MWQSVFHWLVPPTTTNSRLSIRREIDPPLTELCQQLARDLGLEHLAVNVVVVWNPRMRSTAGRAWLLELQIEMNPRLQSLDPQHIQVILRHELAHLVAAQRNKGKRISPHGAEWRRACADLGIPGEKACHRLPLPARKQKIRYLYHCPQCHTEIPRVRPMKKHLACRRCCADFNGGRYDPRFRFVRKAAWDQ